MTLDLTKIIKRLELIKTLISLEEEDGIYDHLTKLKQLNVNKEIEEIVYQLEEKSYGKAVSKIEEFINSKKHMSIYIDPEIEALRFEAKSLEKRIQGLSDEKAELDKLIHEFNVRHNQELGELLLDILSWRKDKTKGTTQYEEAKNDYEDFYSNYQITKKEQIATLTEVEKKQLKDYYRKASKLCHPDVVEEINKLTAHKIFTELNEAYSKNDINRVSEILNNLQNGETFKSKADTANEKGSLLKELERLQRKLREIENEIIEIKGSVTFEKISKISDWDLYFSEKKEQLKKQLELLQSGAK